MMFTLCAEQAAAITQNKFSSNVGASLQVDSGLNLASSTAQMSRNTAVKLVGEERVKPVEGIFQQAWGALVSGYDTVQSIFSSVHQAFENSAVYAKAFAGSMCKSANESAATVVDKYVKPSSATIDLLLVLTTTQSLASHAARLAPSSSSQGAPSACCRQVRLLSRVVKAFCNILSESLFQTHLITCHYCHVEAWETGSEDELFCGVQASTHRPSTSQFTMQLSRNPCTQASTTSPHPLALSCAAFPRSRSSSPLRRTGSTPPLSRASSPTLPTPQSISPQ